MNKVSVSLEMRMEARGYEYTKTSDGIDKFINIEKGIICEVFPDGEYQFIFADKRLFGFLASGKFPDIYNDIKFNQIERGFEKSVNIILCSLSEKGD